MVPPQTKTMSKTLIQINLQTAFNWVAPYGAWAAFQSLTARTMNPGQIR
jgi:hypothetical protein